MEIKPISLTLSDNIQALIEMQKFCNERFNQVVEELGIPEAWGGSPLTNEEINIIHNKFLLKYNLICMHQY